MLTNPFSPAGRLTRPRYALAIVLIAATIVAMRTLVAGSDPATVAAAIIMTIALALPWFCVTAQRLHDFSREDNLAIVAMGLMLTHGGFATMSRTAVGPASGWADAIAGVAGVSTLVMAAAIASRRPTVGPNRFGPDPRDGYAPEKAPHPMEMTPSDLDEHPTAVSPTGMAA